MKLALLSLLTMLFTATPTFADKHCTCDKDCQTKCASKEGNKDGHKCNCKCDCAKTGNCKHHNCHKGKEEAAKEAH